jgi:hypothetical protein
VRSLPSATRTVQITNGARFRQASRRWAPANAATVQLPFFVDWSDTPNPQVPCYDLEFNTSPQLWTRNDGSAVEPKPLRLHDHAGSTGAGNYFWRVRALHGDVAGLWSADARSR